MEDGIGLMTDWPRILLLVPGAVWLILFILDPIFGPSPATLEAQKRLCEADKENDRKRFEDAVQAEMKRMRKSST